MEKRTLYDTESQIVKISTVAAVSIDVKVSMLYLSLHVFGTNIALKIMAIVLDVTIISAVFYYLRSMISEKKAIFDFFESFLVVMAVMGNFYISIIGYGIYFEVFTINDEFDKVVLTVLSFANGNAVYDNKFDGHRWYFSFVSVASMFMFALVMGVLLSMLSRSRDDRE